MTFPEFLEELQKLKKEEQRAQEPDYLEVVIAKEALEPLGKALAAYFGPPLKPAGDAPSGEATQRAAPYGGIRKDQTMYFRQDADLEECAFLWPWGSGARITVKVIRAKQADLKSGWDGFLENLFGRK